MTVVTIVMEAVAGLLLFYSYAAVVMVMDLAADSAADVVLTMDAVAGFGLSSYCSVAVEMVSSS